MRPIDADAIPYTMLYKENWMGCTGIEKRGVWKDTIDAMPTIEPERKKGKWIRTRTIEHDGELYCDQCEQEHPEQKTIWKFCPNCGAKMEDEP